MFFNNQVFYIIVKVRIYITSLAICKRCINIKLRKNIVLNQYVYENCIKYLQLIKYQYIKYLIYIYYIKHHIKHYL